MEMDGPVILHDPQALKKSGAGDIQLVGPHGEIISVELKGTKITTSSSEDKVKLAELIAINLLEGKLKTVAGVFTPKGYGAIFDDLAPSEEEEEEQKQAE